MTIRGRMTRAAIGMILMLNWIRNNYPAVFDAAEVRRKQAWANMTEEEAQTLCDAAIARLRDEWEA